MPQSAVSTVCNAIFLMSLIAHRILTCIFTISKTDRINEQNKTAMARFQKVLAEQKRKLKAYTTRNWNFVEEKKEKSYGMQMSLSNRLMHLLS